MSINVKPLVALVAGALSSPGVIAAEVNTAVSVATALVSAIIDGVNLAEQVYAGLKGDQKAQLVLADVKQLAGELGVNLDAAWSKLERPLRTVVNFVVTLYNLLNLWPFKGSASGQAAPAAATGAAAAISAH